MSKALSGLVVLRKPVGITSRDALNRLARLMPRVKMGHAGTLDPAACGVLVVCVGRATRLVPFVQRMPKEYRASMRLGQRSSTHDLESAVEEMPFTGAIDRNALEHSLNKFRGEIWQVPPQHSAVHVAGRRAYELAREGKSVELEARRVQVDRLDCTRFDYPDAELHIRCSSGTYVRSLVRDIGDDLGCGAVMTGLDRTAIGPFRLADACNAEDLDPQTVLDRLLPPRTAVPELAAIAVPEEHLADVAHGRAFIASLPGGAHSTAREFALLDRTGELLAVAELDRSGRRLLPRVVLMDR